MSGLFKALGLVDERQRVALTPRCGQCRLYKTCNTPKMPVYGAGKKGVLVVGEAPGEKDDNERRPFSPDGRPGELLHRTFTDYGLSLYDDCWVTNSIICRPPRNKIPPRAVDHCQPHVVNTILDLRPTVVVLLGKYAIRSVVGWLWRDKVGAMSRWDGWRIPSQRINAWVCPTYHPSYVLRTSSGGVYEHDGDDDGEFVRASEVVGSFFRRNLRAVAKLAQRGARPWERVPNHAAQVECIGDPDVAAARIRVFMESKLPVAFDFECDGLKPERSDFEIVSCSMSDGTTTIAYPWVGAAVSASVEFIKSGVPKIASNLGYEQRVAMRRLGVRVRNWAWDTMQAAHVLDNRRSISSIKFQGFVLLGEDVWDHAAHSYFKSSSANSKNKIREMPMGALLKYNGLDSLIEWKVAEIQMRKFDKDIRRWEK